MSIVKFSGNGNITRRVTAIAKGSQEAIEEAHEEFIPRVDVWETRDHVFLTIELPGLTRDHVEVIVTEDRLLTVRGEKLRITPPDEVLWAHQERRYGAFERAFPLPPTVDIEHIQGEFKDGLLMLSLTKRQLQAPRTIVVPIS